MKYLFLIIVLAIGIYKLPVNVDKSNDGVIIYNKYQKIEEHVTVKLQGKIARNILSVNDFDGTISIGDDNAETYTVGAGNFKTLLRMKSRDYYYFVYNKQLLHYSKKVMQSKPIFKQKLKKNIEFSDFIS